MGDFCAFMGFGVFVLFPLGGFLYDYREQTHRHAMEMREEVLEHADEEEDE